MNDFTFERPELSRRLADDLLGKSLFGADSGMFLAGPRRTGKSFFLKNDLAPLLEKEGVEVIYTDLWEDRNRNPAETITSAIRDKLALGPLARLRDSSGLKNFSIPGFGFDLGLLGAPRGPTITDALRFLAENNSNRVCLIVDEAQHALSTPEGRNIMFALKAARDALNQGNGGLSKGFRGRNLMLVFTGSNRHRLASMTIGREQAFYGATVIPFPLLGDEYAVEYAAWINTRLTKIARIGADDMVSGFALLWRRPELLREAVKSHVNDGADFMQSVAGLRMEEWAVHERMFRSLTSLQQAMLVRICSGQNNEGPFTRDAMNAYSAMTGNHVSKVEVQAALEGLITGEKIWRSGHGIYVPENPSVAEWMQDTNPDVEREELCRPVGELLGELLAIMSLEVLSVFLNCTPKTLRGWRDGVTPREAAVSRIVKLHTLLVLSGLGRSMLAQNRNILESLLSGDEPDWETAERTVQKLCG